MNDQGQLDRRPTDQEVDEFMADDASMPMLAAESALAREWLTPEEDEAWAHL